MPPISRSRRSAVVALALFATGTALAAAPGSPVNGSGGDSASAHGKGSVELAKSPNRGGGRKIR